MHMMTIIKRCRMLIGTTLLINSLAHADIVVITNAKNTEVIKAVSVRQIFLAKIQTFPSGAMAFPVESAVSQKEFSEKFLQMTPESLNAYWARLLFTGEAKPLKKLASDDDVIKFVLDHPNAIGYIDSTKVTSSVKVVN